MPDSRGCRALYHSRTRRNCALVIPVLDDGPQPEPAPRSATARFILLLLSDRRAYQIGMAAATARGATAERTRLK